jgi:hypothetical protein
MTYYIYFERERERENLLDEDVADEAKHETVDV